MKKKIAYTYLLTAWLAYILFGYSMFPELQITVMLFSIPLAILAGWLFSYKGAVINTLLTIPYHYLLLYHFSDHPHILLEALNPFGIGTLTFFSVGTAFFKATQIRYQQLNSTLELAIQERTQDLTALTDHLIETKESMLIVTAQGLLKEPIGRLNSMLGTSKLLTMHLIETNHPDCDAAENIVNLINVCSYQLQTIGQQEDQNLNQTDAANGPVEELMYQLKQLAGDRTKIFSAGNWDQIDPDLICNLHPIIHEAVTNALRHAAPTQITIGIQSKSTSFIISVENNGKTMPADTKEGMGIPLMRYRARRLGGSLSIHSTKDNNTHIECVLPRQ